VLSSVAETYRRWCCQTEAGLALFQFRFAFAAIWLCYDLADLVFRGTASILWVFPAKAWPLAGLQLLLIATQSLVLIGVKPRLACLLCFVLRLTEAEFFYSLNDFYYYAIVMLILSQVSIAGPNSPTRSWPRHILIAQLAWIYFATALLKLNPEWLSGGHLFVRQSYLDFVQHWPYPALYRTCCINLRAGALLARAGVTGELLMVFLLATRRWPRCTILLAISLHLFAALALNVWFFGASMVAQVAFLLWPRPGTCGFGGNSPSGE